MNRTLFAVTVLTVAMIWGTGPSRAQNDGPEGPWCATVFNGEGSVKEICHFKDFESCRMEVVAGNRGTCGNNPRYVAKHDPRWSTQSQTGQPAKRISKHKHARRTQG